MDDDGDGIQLFSAPRARKKQKVDHHADQPKARDTCTPAVTAAAKGAASTKPAAVHEGTDNDTPHLPSQKDNRRAAQQQSHAQQAGISPGAAATGPRGGEEALGGHSGGDGNGDSSKQGKQQKLQHQRQPQGGKVDTQQPVEVVGAHSEPPDPNLTFKDLGVSDWLCAIVQSLGMARPTHVQQGCIPAILEGRDVIGLAQTGSGKTAAFALPILQLLAKDPFGVFALVMTPTRELAIQISEQLAALGAGMSLRELVIIGGTDMQSQAKALARRPHVVVATPGRLKGLLDADVNLKATLSNARFLVLDEADRLLDPSFEDDLRGILPHLPPPRSGRRQTLLFSATMTRSLVRLQAAVMEKAFVFQAYEGLKTAEGLKEQYVFIPSEVKEVYLAHLLAAVAPEQGVRSAIVFVATCRGCHALKLVLDELGLPCAALHSGLPQKHRLASLARFKSQQVPLLLATDVASRGLDIPTVDLVINYDLPMLARDYVHRVGRTARAGRSGWSVCLVSQHEVELVQRVEALLGHTLQALELPEAEVLKGITKVYSAKRAAMLKLAEEEGLDTKKSKRVKRAAKQL